jgi:hypothetical protein
MGYATPENQQQQTIQMFAQGDGFTTTTISAVKSLQLL